MSETQDDRIARRRRWAAALQTAVVRHRRAYPYASLEESFDDAAAAVAAVVLQELQQVMEAEYARERPGLRQREWNTRFASKQAYVRQLLEPLEASLPVQMLVEEVEADE